MKFYYLLPQCQRMSGQMLAGNQNLKTNNRSINTHNIQNDFPRI